MDIGAWAEMDGVKIWNQLGQNLKKLSPKNRASRGLKSIVDTLIIPYSFVRYHTGGGGHFTLPANLPHPSLPIDGVKF